MNASWRTTTPRTTTRRPMILTLDTTRLRSHAVALVILAAWPATASAQSGPPGCVGDTEAAQVKQLPGPAVRFGINARAVTGQIGPLPAQAVPEDPAKQLAKLDELRRPGAPFPLRLTRFFWRDGEAGFQAFLTLTDQYTSHGFPVDAGALPAEPPAGGRHRRVGRARARGGAALRAEPAG